MFFSSGDAPDSRTGIIESFMAVGAAAIIAPRWSVRDAVAHEVVTEFYDKLRQPSGVKVGNILREIRAKAYTTHPGEDSVAAYALYGRPVSCT